MNQADINNQIDFITAAAEALKTGDHEQLDILKDINSNWMQQDDQTEANMELIRSIRRAIEDKEELENDISFHQSNLRKIKKIASDARIDL